MATPEQYLKKNYIKYIKCITTKYAHNISRKYKGKIKKTISELQFLPFIDYY